MLKTGQMNESDMIEAESCMSRSAGHCMTMGTASTMASMVEALGIGLPTNAAIPAVDSRRKVLARMAGRRIVEMVREDLRMSKILTKLAFENAIMVNGAIGGSTNAVVHLLAIAGRVGVPLSLDDWDRLGRDMPCLVNLMPSGQYLMEDFYYAGGLPVVMKEIGKYLRKDALTVNGRTIWDNCKDAVNYNSDVITPLGKPFKPQGGIAVLRGNLAPQGAVLKPSAATPALMQHKGRAVVFEDIDDLNRRIDDPKLDVDASCILVLKNCGPKGYPGFPEVGNFLSYARLVRCAHESGGKKLGSGGKKIGNPHLRWAFSEAACLFLRQSDTAKKWLQRQEKKRGKGKALGIHVPGAPLTIHSAHARPVPPLLAMPNRLKPAITQKFGTPGTGPTIGAPSGV